MTVSDGVERNAAAVGYHDDPSFTGDNRDKARKRVLIVEGQPLASFVFGGVIRAIAMFMSPPRSQRT